MAHLNAGFGKYRWRGGFRGDGGGGGDRRGSVPQGGDDLALGVEEQLRGDGLDLKTVEGKSRRRGASA